ncbi:uncharacterized protein [Drosophila takahashii]|uniref:uncharacterized protein n=1 Tax=Drosophila takahashii TaxID=29030 RepID=UPI001CF911C5|nr:annexin A7 [Drosophila takahashii]
MLSTHHLAVIMAVLFCYLQFQATVVARTFTPARTHQGRYNHSTGYNQHGNKNYTRAVASPNWIVPANHQPAYQAPGFSAPPQNHQPAYQAPGYSAPHQNRTQGFYGVPAQTASVPSGWVVGSSNQQQPGGILPSGWFQGNPSQPQGQIGTPAQVFGKGNATVYPAYNQTVAHGKPYSSPYGNLSI